MDKRRQYRAWLWVGMLVLTSLACSLFSGLLNATETPTNTPTLPDAGQERPTPTPTQPAAQEVAPSLTPPPGRCAGLSGSLDAKVLVGPADAVGLEPTAVGNIPFAVTTDAPPYLLTGSGPIDYADVLVEDWGTYEVTMNLQIALSGECHEETETLQITVEMSGEQLVRVDAGEFQGEYPWSGTQTIELEFPLQEGASASGEGWEFVLHLAGQ